MTEETRTKFRERLDWLLVPAMIALLLGPALWNGFPLIFPDTGGYLLRPLEGTLALGRSAVYGTFLAAGLPLDFWPNVLIQAAGTVFVIRVLLRTHGLGGRPWLAVILVVALAAFTALPWYVSLLMPEIWAGWAVLALYLLAFRRDALSRVEMLTLGAMIVFAIASHMATLALCLGLTVCFALIRFAGPYIRMPRPRLGVGATALVAGALLCPTANYLIADEFAFTPGGTTFVFGRLVQDGLITRYLDEHCPDEQVSLCRYATALPKTADEWLWTRSSPIHQLGGWEAYTPESKHLILATLRLYPGQHLSTAVQAAIDQFLSFRTTLSVDPDDNFRRHRDIRAHLVPRSGCPLSCRAAAARSAGRERSQSCACAGSGRQLGAGRLYRRVRASTRRSVHARAVRDGLARSSRQRDHLRRAVESE